MTARKVKTVGIVLGGLIHEAEILQLLEHEWGNSMNNIQKRASEEEEELFPRHSHKEAPLG